MLDRRSNTNLIHKNPLPHFWLWYVINQKSHERCFCVKLKNTNDLIESIKTTSMEDVSTRVLEKIKNI